MTRTAALVALAASALLLAGCAPAVDLPPPITQAEAKKVMADQQLSWWESMFPGEPMPVVDPIEFVDPNTYGTQSNDCLKAANLEGISFSPDGGWTTTTGSREQLDLINRALFICSAEYPYDTSDPADMGLLSDEQIGWIWSYNKTRLVPCLQQLGYAVTNRSGDYVEGTGGLWIPYYDMTPAPTQEEWPLIELHCPRSPVGPDYRPIYQTQGG